MIEMTPTIETTYRVLELIGVWAVTGSTETRLAGVSPLGCVLMALVTATGGSVIRDMMSGRIPHFSKISR